jgi:hypothetical protein
MDALYRLNLVAFILYLTQPFAGAQVSHNPDELVVDGRQQRIVISVVKPQQQIRFEHLIPGEQYALSVPDEQSIQACKPAIAFMDPTVKDFAMDTIHQVITFTATAPEHTFLMRYPCSWDENDPPRHYISLLCQTCKKKDLKEYLRSMPILDTESGIPANDLIKEVLIGGNCFDITDVSFTGSGSAIGKFYGGLTNIGFSTGMIMATGDISVAIGPNDADNASAGFGAGASDSDLTALSGSSNLFDLANIEFDFTPTQTPLTFEYVFASEEYCEYVNSPYNDAFGFFISGPGINGPFGGAANIAVLPGGNYVSINTVNHLTNAGFYQNNTGPNGQLCGQNPTFLPAVNEVQFDGYTRRMVAVAPVIPCETYRIKLKIADVGDGLYDSAVFLREGSFSGGGGASIEFEVNGDINLKEVYEGCGTVRLIIRRVGGNANLPLPVSFVISGTATVGEDYLPFPSTVIIPPGQTELILTITILNDAILEGDETIIITPNNPCSCLNPEETLTIKDLPVLDATADTTTICGPGVGTFSVTPIDGVEPYTFNWQNGQSGQEISTFVSVSTNYRVTVTDACGKTVVRTSRVEVSPPPIAQLVPPAPQLCPGQTVSLTINFMGNPNAPYTIRYTRNGDYYEITDILDNPYLLVIDEPGLYSMFNVTDANGCVGSGIGTVLVTESTLALSGIVGNADCSGGSNGFINTTAVGGQVPYTYEWDGPQPIGNQADPTGLSPGEYLVTVTDNFGCTQEQSFIVSAPSPVAVSVTGIQGVNCINPTGGSITVNTIGGTPGYAYAWSNGSNQQHPQNLPAGNYTVTVTDNKGCTSTESALVPGDFTAPTVAIGPAADLTCAAPTIALDGSSSSSGQGYSAQWTANPGNILSGANTLTPLVNQIGHYILTITNAANGCTASDTTAVQADTEPPVVAAGPDMMFTCTIDTVYLNGSGSSQGPEFLYQWSASAGGTILHGANTLSPQVGTPGRYTLLVTNTLNGCTRTDLAAVSSDYINPTAGIASPGLLTCVNTTITLDGGISSPPGQLGFAWSTTNGLVVSGADTPSPVVGEPGLYTLTVTNSINGCTDVASVTVSQSADVPIAAIAPVNTLNCTVLQAIIDANSSSQGPGITYNWSASAGGNILSGANTLTPTINAGGTYTLLVSDAANNCSATSSVSVDQNSTPPEIQAGTSPVMTCLQPLAVLNGIVLSGSGNYTYLWNGPGIASGGNTSTPTINASGVYTLVVTDLINGCTASDALTALTDQMPPNAAIAPAGPLTCATTSLSINGGASSQGTSMQYSWSGPTLLSGQGTLSPAINQPGTYTLTVTNAQNGCSATASVIIGQDIELPAADAGPDNLLNCYTPQIQLGGSGNPAGPNFSFQWSGPGIVSGGQSPTPTVNAGGQYTLTVTNTTNGCTASDAVLLNENFALPQADAGPTFELTCVERSYQIQSSASQGSGFTYGWTTQNGSFLSPTNVLNPTVNGAGIYTLLVTNTVNGCTASSQVAITQAADVPVAVAGTAPTLTCTILSVQLNGAGSSGSPTITYNWSTQNGNIVGGQGSLSPVVDAPGIYTLTVLDASNNCEAVSSVTVEADRLIPVVDAGSSSTLTCAQPQLALEGSVAQPGSFTYSWQASGGGNILSGANTLTPTVNAGGTYNLSVTNLSNGCIGQASILVSVNQDDPVAAIANPDILTCAVSQVALDASLSSTGNMAHTWFTPNGNIADQSNPMRPIVDMPGIYRLVVLDMENGCADTMSVAVNQDIQLPQASASVNDILTCSNKEVSLSGLGSSQGSSFKYTWSTTNGSLTGGASTLTPGVNSAGIYLLTVENTVNGCTSTAQVAVSIDTIVPVVSIATPGILSCVVKEVTLYGASSQTGPMMAFSWSTAGGNINGGQNTASASVSQSGQYTLQVTNTNTGCSGSGSVLVQDDIVLPVAKAGNPKLLTCAVQSVVLGGTGSIGSQFTYQWTTTDGQIVSGANTLNPTVNKPGTYVLLVTNTATGCTKTDDARVDVETDLPTDFVYEMKRPTCKDNDGVVTFGVVTGGYEPYLFSINGGASFGSNDIFSGLAPGTYQLAIQDANGCEYEQMLVIPKAPDPEIDIIPLINIDLGESAILQASLPPGYPLSLVDTILWSPLEGLAFNSYSMTDLLRPVATPTRRTEYTVTVVSGDGCRASDRVVIQVDNEPRIFIPNVFRPSDNDPQNNKVTIFAKTIQIKQIKTFQIYDRWGERVFEVRNFQPNDPSYGWDGAHNGRTMQPAVFVYFAEIELVDGRTLLYKGDVTLVD